MSKFTSDMIPNRMRDAKYQIGMSASYLPQWLDEARNDYGLDLQPDYQRPLVWGPERQTAFLEFLLRGGKGNARNITFNSPAFGQEGKATGDIDDTLELVDGQQRLNAVLDFLADKVPVFGNYRFSDFDKSARIDAMGPTGSLSLTFFVNNLQNREEVLTYYLELNEGGMAHTAEELERVRQMRDQARTGQAS